MIGTPGFSPQDAADREASSFGQHHIENHQDPGAPGWRGSGLFAIDGAEHPISSEFQAHLQHPPHVGFVIPPAPWQSGAPMVLWRLHPEQVWVVLPGTWPPEALRKRQPYNSASSSMRAGSHCGEWPHQGQRAPPHRLGSTSVGGQPALHRCSMAQHPPRCSCL